MLVRFWAQARRVTTEHGGSDPLVAIKEPNGSHGAGLVMSLLPRARLIFLIRDGRDVVDSLLARRMPGGSQDPPRKTLVADGSERGAPPVQGERARLAYVRGTARLWAIRMAAVQAAYESHPPPLRYRLHYEDLRRDTIGVLGPLGDWLGLSRGPDEVRAAAHELAFEALPDERKGFGRAKRAARPGLWRESLSAPEQRCAEEIMGPKLAELGYEV